MTQRNYSSLCDEKSYVILASQGETKNLITACCKPESDELPQYILRVDSESRSFLAVQNDGSHLGAQPYNTSSDVIPDEPKRAIWNLALNITTEIPNYAPSSLSGMTQRNSSSLRDKKSCVILASQGETKNLLTACCRP
ncbi:hypothetical protein [Vibrio rotiferianus]|uniref:hypothetical protein n=1 Tax=Vibrio rotiferianus TaxID=190895 RepID=UPI001ED97890|nr:hypothetical protein [Vibrio rotiferianus]